MNKSIKSKPYVSNPFDVTVAHRSYTAAAQYIPPSVNKKYVHTRPIKTETTTTATAAAAANMPIPKIIVSQRKIGREKQKIGKKSSRQRN